MNSLLSVVASQCEGIESHTCDSLFSHMEHLTVPSDVDINIEDEISPHLKEDKLNILYRGNLGIVFLRDLLTHLSFDIDNLFEFRKEEAKTTSLLVPRYEREFWENNKRLVGYDLKYFGPRTTTDNRVDNVFKIDYNSETLETRMNMVSKGKYTKYHEPNTRLGMLYAINIADMAWIMSMMNNFKNADSLKIILGDLDNDQSGISKYYFTLMFVIPYTNSQGKKLVKRFAYSFSYQKGIRESLVYKVNLL